MVTRRAVLKGTAAASIGAIAAAHGAAPADAAPSLSLGYGELTGGVIGGFQKYSDAFQIALKFHKSAVELFYKEQPAGGVGIFIKVFEKHWVAEELVPDRFEILSGPQDGGSVIFRSSIPAARTFS